MMDNSNPRVGADHGVDFDWLRQSRDCPDVSAKILNSVQHCRSASSKGANSAIEQYRTATRLHYDENSVCPSVCLSIACIVTKRKKDMFRFLYHECTKW